MSLSFINRQCTAVFCLGDPRAWIVGRDCAHGVSYQNNIFQFSGSFVSSLMRPSFVTCSDPSFDNFKASYPYAKRQAIKMFNVTD